MNIFLLMVVVGIFILNPVKAFASDAIEQYVNSTWGLRVDVPAHWVITDTQALLKELEKDPQVTVEILNAVKDSGMLVTISEHPLEAMKEINPNVSIAAKKISTDPKPQEEKDWVQFAGDVMAKIVPDPLALSAPQQEHIHELVGLSSNFFTDVPEKGRVRSTIYVLIDQQAWNYFIITATFSDDKAVESQVMAIISSLASVGDSKK